jgi:hypothetical protein
MKKPPCIVESMACKIKFDDGYEGVVDLRPLIAKGKVFAWLSETSHFAAVRVDEFGHSVSWLDGQGYTIDLSADSIRRDGEREAEMHRRMVSRVRRSQENRMPKQNRQLEWEGAEFLVLGQLLIRGIVASKSYTNQRSYE